MATTEQAKELLNNIHYPPFPFVDDWTYSKKDVARAIIILNEIEKEQFNKVEEL